MQFKRVLTQIFVISCLVLALLVSYLLCNAMFDDFNMFEQAMSGKYAQLIVWMIIVIFQLFVYGYIGIKVGTRFKFFGSGENNLASSDFATIRDFKDFTGEDGIMIGKEFRLSAKKSYEHVLLVGPTGSGKSASFFIPNLLTLPNSSIVVSDPKGELFQKTAATNMAQGKRILVFSPFKKNSMKYNPLSLCNNVSEVRELAQILLANGNAAVEAMTGSKAGGGNSEWVNMSVPLLCSFLLYAKMLGNGKNTVTYALNLIVENDLETLKFLMMDADDQAKRQFNIFMQSAESEKTASSIKTVLATNLQLFMDPMIEEVTSANEINPLMLRQKPTVLYVVVPEHKSDTMAPLMAPFYSQLMNKLLENGEGTEVFFLLDEFPNIGIIPNIDKALAVVRSRRISISIALQSVNQLKQRYGESSETILENLKSKCILPGSGIESAKKFSEMAGFREIDTMSTSFGKENLSHSLSKQKRELLSADEIRTLADGTMLIVTDNKMPFIDKQNRYYQDPKMLKMTQNEMDIDQYVTRLRQQINASKQKRRG